jgi:hypothetical protein
MSRSYEPGGVCHQSASFLILLANHADWADWQAGDLVPPTSAITPLRDRRKRAQQ